MSREPADSAKVRRTVKIMQGVRRAMGLPDAVVPKPARTLFFGDLALLQYIFKQGFIDRTIRMSFLNTKRRHGYSAKAPIWRSAKHKQSQMYSRPRLARATGPGSYDHCSPQTLTNSVRYFRSWFFWTGRRTAAMYQKIKAHRIDQGLPA